MDLNKILKQELPCIVETRFPPSSYGLRRTGIASLRKNEPLSKHSAYRIGGLAEYFLEIKNFSILPELFKIINKYKIPFFVFGKGTNILFPDKGLNGIVIENSTKTLEIHGEEAMIDSGVEMGKILNELRGKNLTGLENLWGLPGTIGGAVFGNAGRKEVEIGEKIIKVEYFDVNNLKFKTIDRERCKFAYRESVFKKHPKRIITKIYLKLTRSRKEEIEKKVNKILKEMKKYPSGFHCGSFFKNPSPEMPAGKLIEECGLKGYRIGDAEITEEHGNFIVNTGKAKARDILKLADLAEKKVQKKFKIKLEREVRVPEKLRKT